MNINLAGIHSRRLAAVVINYCFCNMECIVKVVR
jgi:hypothetical protein